MSSSRSRACGFGGDDEPSRWEFERPGCWPPTRSWPVPASMSRPLPGTRRRSGPWSRPTRRWLQPRGRPVRVWEPLLYPASARHDPGISEEAPRSARPARAAGARRRPERLYYLWHGLYPPYTAAHLRAGQPRRGRAPARIRALAELLLTAGADANDGQLLYDRQFGDDDRALWSCYSTMVWAGGRRAVGKAVRRQGRLARRPAARAAVVGDRARHARDRSGCWSTTAPTSARRYAAPGGDDRQRCGTPTGSPRPSWRS